MIKFFFLLICFMAWALPVETHDPTFRALESLRQAQQAWAEKDSGKMMNHVLEALRAKGTDSVIVRRALDLAKNYLRQDNPPALFEHGLIEPWIQVRREKRGEQDLSFTLQLGLKTRRPEKIRRVSFTSASGREIMVHDKTTYTEIYPSKMPGHFTFRSWSAEMPYLAAGLYQVKVEIEGEELHQFPVLLDPDLDASTLPALSMIPGTNMLSWKVHPGSVGDLNKTYLTLSLYRKEQVLPSSAERPSWQSMVAFNSPSAALAGKIAAQVVPSLACKIEGLQENVAKMGDLLIVYEHVSWLEL